MRDRKEVGCGPSREICIGWQVITTEWINGVQLAKCEPAVINKLIPVGVNCFLAQLLDVGFFHSDPHPGETRKQLLATRLAFCRA